MFVYVCFLKFIYNLSMKHTLCLTAILALSVGAVSAQSAEHAKKPAATAQPAKANAAPAQVKRVDGAATLQSGTPVRTSAVKMEDIDRGIAEINKILKDNEGIEGFQKEAYEKRLVHLTKIKSEQSTTPTSTK
jgi:hypothetical protein